MRLRRVAPFPVHHQFIGGRVRSGRPGRPFGQGRRSLFQGAGPIVASGMRQCMNDADGTQAPMTEEELEKLFLTLA
ncbi:hypothetical protein GCM10010425_83140 [Streptomyces spororaveus]|uniref:Uncharacterized protein n=1 Tax=Streptomyces spororaveus TaxID=284039 RepID=A0ABQ3T5N5_9ACTN|nr:hypothetical protein Sspor_12700 [Streptomyces spororaveus]